MEPPDVNHGGHPLMQHILTITEETTHGYIRYPSPE